MTAAAAAVVVVVLVMVSATAAATVIKMVVVVMVARARGQRCGAPCASALWATVGPRGACVHMERKREGDRAGWLRSARLG